RIDYQVKLRGFRIELSEIESSLVKHPKIQEAVVLVREDSEGDQRIVAYIVPTATEEGSNQNHPALLAEWRDFLSLTLPDYMIPSHFVVLEKLPLTPNGKIDRKALPATETAVTATDIELPVTETEKSLAQLWAKLLKYEVYPERSRRVIARQDNFFNLGGNSLLATQLCYRIRETFKIELSLSQVFETPTLMDLANYLDSCLWINFATTDIEPLNSDEEEIEL
ncbi:MAG: AMP-binding enzyme, partial [Sphaerospermopsis kisseleviana]